MAMTTASTKALEPGRTRLAGVAATLLALAATVATAVALINHLTGAQAGTGHRLAYLVLLLTFAAIGLVAGAQLLRGRPGAQQFLLVYWLAVLVTCTSLAIAVLLWGLPEGLFQSDAEAAAGSTRPLVAGLLLLGVVLGALVVALLVRASEANSRQRYGSIVIVSVGVAIALVVVVNLVAQKRRIHRSMETLGRYSLSERTKKILGDVSEPVRLTCVYTSADEAKQTDDLRPRVLELMEDMRIHGKDVEVANVTTDAEKARLLGRLRGQLGTQADKHDEFVRKFDQQADAFLKEVEAAQQGWESHPAESYLNMWSMPLEVAHTMKTGAEKLRRAQGKVKTGLEGQGLPDYADLVREIKDAVRPFKEGLEKNAELFKTIDKISKSLADETKRKVALAAADQCLVAANEAAAIIGKAGDAAPQNPTEVLKKFITAARRTTQLATVAAKQLDNLAEADQAELLRENRSFMVAAGNVGVVLSDYFRLVTQLIVRDADEAEAIVKNAKAEYQSKFIVQTRPKVAQIAQSLGTARQAAAAALDKLATVDPRSRKELDLAVQDKLFEATTAKLKATLDEAEKLPELKSTSLSSDISGENIVIVEAAGKAEVVDFDAVWPLKVRRMGMASAPEGPQKRVFNGDSAIGSKVLAVTQKPFATVLLTYWGPGRNMPPQMARMTPPADIPHQALGAVRKRLEEANFEVKDWNLTEDMPEGDDDDANDRPKLLLVLPPPPAAQQSPFQRQPMPTPKFQDEHRQKVVDAINDGLPAIFLATFSPPRQMAMFMPPMQTPYAYGDYLRNEWGIDVKTDYLVVPAVTDEKMPGRYKVDGQRFSYLPLSSFSDHPIGEPLKAQRVLWTNLCPVSRRADARGEPLGPPKGVKIEPLLSVPAHWKSTWATRRIQELLRQFQSVEGSYIWPDYAAGDIPAGFDVAVAATRSPVASPAAKPPAKDPNQDPNQPAKPADSREVQPARIVVLGVGTSLMDGYMDREVAVRDAKGTISLTDRPRANADLLVNSAYWLTGRQNLIASGPVQATMKEIPPTTKILLVMVYCVLLPALVLGAGGLVMLKRRS